MQFSFQKLSAENKPMNPYLPFCLQSGQQLSIDHYLCVPD